VILITALACAEVHNLNDVLVFNFHPILLSNYQPSPPVNHPRNSIHLSTTTPNLFDPQSQTKPTVKMPPKAAAEKKPASKAPAKAPVEKKEAGKKTAASGDKKKRTKTRKETYSSYIYKGMVSHTASRLFVRFSRVNGLRGWAH
jgi:hypothetical protein